MRGEKAKGQIQEPAPIFNWIGSAPISDQSQERILSLLSSFGHFLDKRGPAGDGSVLWEGGRDYARQALASASKACSSAKWFPKYGCAVLVLPTPGGLQLVQVCLDEFEFATHSGQSGVEFYSSPSGWSLLHVGEISDELTERLWAEVDLRLLEAASVSREKRHADNAESHQKTPSFIFSLVQNAIKTVTNLRNLPATSEVDEVELRRLRREDDKKPRGGFTDVGRHTGGEPRHTSWPLVLATIEAAVTHVFPIEAAGGHTKNKVPNPRILCRQASAHFVLWQLQCGVNQLDDATPKRLQKCMVMLREAYECCSELIDHGLDMRSFSSACKEAREALEDAREERAEKCALQYHLPDVEHCAEASEWRNVVLALPEEAVYEAEGDSEEAVRKRAKSNLGFIPLIQRAPEGPSAAGLVQTSKWLNDLQPASSNEKIMQIAMRSVEDYLFSFSRSNFELVVNLAGIEESSEEVTALVDIVKVYRSVHESFLKSDAACFRMRTVLLGRRTLVEWVSFCLIHSICGNMEPILLKYGVALRFSELDHLSLDDKGALDCCMKVCDYLHKYAKPDREVFSLRSPSSEQATLDMAYEIATEGTFKEIFKELRERDRIRARRREELYWKEVERKQALARKLRRDIASKEQEIRELDVEIRRDEIRDYWGNQATNRRRRDRAKEELDHIKSKLGEAEEAPPPLFHNLPSNDRKAYEALFFLHMSQSFRALSEMSFAAQELLLPSPWKQPKDTVAPDFYPGGGWNIVRDISSPASATTWEDLYTLRGVYHEGQRNAATVGKVFLRDTVVHLPEHVGPKKVDDVNSRNHGIFTPDVFSRQMGWVSTSGGKPQCINPFAPVDKNWRILTHTEQLSKPSEPKHSLQWAMPMLEGDVTKSRGNWAFALQHRKPKFLTKQEFLSFGCFRSFPLQQHRKLCNFLNGNFLPLNHLDVHVLLRQAMYQVGEIQVSKDDAQCFPFSKTDLLNEEFRSDLVGEMERLHDKLRNTPRDHKSILILGELCAFLADFDVRFDLVRIHFAEVVRGWVEELHSKITSVEPKHAPGFRGKQRMFCLYIVSCFAAGPIDAHGCGLLLDALVLFKNGAVFEDETEFDADIRGLLVVTHNIMGGRVYDVIDVLDKNPSVLTNAVRKVVEDVPTDVVWKPSQGDKPLSKKRSSCRSSCYEAVAGKDIYHINIITGVVLFNGKPPRGLPQSIRTHALFRRTFGDVNFDVVEPANKPGVFRTSNKVGGRFFYDFSLHDKGARLCVLEEDTEQEDLALRVVELLDGVDSAKWGGDLPVRLRELHSHWLSRSMMDFSLDFPFDGMDVSLKGVVILRGINFRDRGVHFVFMGSRLSDNFVGSKVPMHLRSKPWTCAANNYGLDKLVLPRDKSAQRIMSILSKFESPNFTHVYRLDSARNKLTFFDPPSGPSVFRIEMPRFALSFQLDSSHLSSLDFRDYVVASHQKLTKTLFEFDEYIVLSLNAAVDIEPRPATIVVVPDGCVRRDEKGAVTVCTRDSKDENRCDTVRASFDYGFHKRLDHLVARNSASRLHLAALYAATGTLLPEKVLRMTGTQLACELVRQCWKNSPLSADEFAHLKDVVSFCAHSPSLALVCRELEQSSSQLIKLHGIELRDERLHFPHFGQPCWHGTSAGCDSVQDLKTAYLHERRSRVHHARLALTVEEEKTVLGVVSCTFPLCGQTMTADHQRAGQINRWFKFADDVSRGLKYLSGEGDVSNVTEPLGMSGWFSRLQQRKHKKAKLHHQTPGPGAAFPLADLEATMSTTKLGREMMDELKNSWQTCDQLIRDKAKKRPPCLDIQVLVRAFDEALQAVRKRREESEDSLFTWMRAVPKDDVEGVKIETMWAADLLPLPTKQDFLRIALENEALENEAVRDFNPLLRNDQTVSRGAVAWAELCVLEDKLQRLQEYGKRQETALIFKELEVWREWDARKYPEWLVMEVEGRVQIRNKQYHVASHLLDPKNHGDIVQLNMGEGKTRFVLPMVWLVLSKTGRERNQPDWLVRATFLNALLAEARDHLQLYTSASVLRKRLYFMPFHRDVELSPLDLLLLQEALSQCRRTGGLLMVAPEHRNSLALKAQEWHFHPSYTARLDSLDAMMTGGQIPFFDILDESDLILSHQYQLVYAVGSPCELGDGERRWFAVEAVLRVIAQDPEVWRILCMPDVSKASRGSLSSAYPRVQLICGKALEAISADLVDAICKAVIEHPPYPFRWFENKRTDEKGVIIQVMMDRTADTARWCERFSLLEYKDLLAFRGLLSHDVLLHILQKRFGVDYGLKKKPLGEKRMAVPYRAADTPSERSEFAHPDCSIMQTYLAYYYQGLDEDQVLEALRKLLSPGMGTERRRRDYDEWLNLSRPDITDAHWESLNMVDKIDFSNGEQMELACKYFRSNYETINFFLANCVLPSDTQQYPHKLVSSAWNLAENCKGGATVGFSGTNDHHRLLPQQVRQADSGDKELKATNGKMLNILVQNDRLVEFALPSSEGDSLGTLWQQVMNVCLEHNVSALIDSGGILAGISNLEAAKHMLQTLPSLRDLKGVTYFDVNQSSWMVLSAADTQSKRLSNSPIRERDTFVIYDESRCRGADLKLNNDAVALVTLGLKMCKDKLMQAAARMRKLSEGQRLVFLVTAEVAVQARTHSQLDQGSKLTVHHILAWVMHNTVRSTSSGLTQWGEKGMVFATTHGCREVCRIEEKLDLEKLYARPLQKTSSDRIMRATQKLLVDRRTAVSPTCAWEQQISNWIERKASEYGTEFQVEANVLDEECERELEREEEEEEEEEMQVARREPREETDTTLQTLLPSIDRGNLLSTMLKNFVVTELIQGKDSTQHIAWSKSLSCTLNFFQTVQEQGLGSDTLNEYLRSADVAVLKDGKALLLSDREADQWLRDSVFGTKFDSITLVHTNYVVSQQQEQGASVRYPLSLGGRAVNQLSSASAASILLFSGATVYPNSNHKEEIERMLMQSEAAKVGAINIVRMRGNIDSFIRSDLDKVVGPGIAESMK